jgi:hypothetical protein
MVLMNKGDHFYFTDATRDSNATKNAKTHQNTSKARNQHQ